MLRAAVIGVGYLGNFHSQKYKLLSQDPKWDLQLVGVCDSHFPQAEKIAKDLQVPAFSRPQDLLGQVDLVTIATTSPTHFASAKMFLENGVHVNVEKPMALNSVEAAQLVSIAKANSLCLAAGHSERFNPAFIELKKALHRPKLLEFCRHAPFKARGSEVSVILDLMIHDLDLMLSMDSTQVRVTMAQGGSLVSETYDWATAAFEFESGMKCTMSSSRVAPAMVRSIRAAHTAGIITANLQTGDLEFAKKSDGIEPSVVQTVVSAGRGDNLLAETESFVSAVLGKSHLVASGEAGEKALALAEIVIGSIESSRGW